MGCSSSKTSKSSQPVPAVYAAPNAEEPAVESTEPAVTEAKDVQTEQMEQAEQVEQVEQVPVSESKDETEKMDIEEAEKAIGDLKESELKMTHVEAKAEKAEDTETVTTAPKEDSPRLLDLKVEAAETQSGPCICGSLWWVTLWLCNLSSRATCDAICPTLNVLSLAKVSEVDVCRRHGRCTEETCSR